MPDTVLAPTASVGIFGYVFDQTGIRIWPFSSHHRLWANLTHWEYGTVNFGHGPMFVLKLHFDEIARKPLELRQKRGIKNFRKIAQVVRLAKSAQPEVKGWPEIEVQDILDVARFEDSSAKARELSDKELLNRGRLRMAALLFKSARADFAALIERGAACEAEAARRKIQAELSDSDPDDALLTLQGLLGKHPENMTERSQVAIYLLRSNDERGAGLADGVLARDPTSFPGLVQYYAGYLVRQKKLEAAQQLLIDYPVNRAKLTAEEKAAVEKFRAEIDGLRLNPQTAFKELVVRPKLTWLRNWGLLLLIAALLSWSLFKIGPVFAREEWRLAQLRNHGAKADLVQGVKLQESTNSNVFVSEITYLYAPDKTKAAALTPPKIPDIGSPKFQESLDAVKQYVDEEIAGKMPTGWYRGDALVFKGTGKEIQANPKEQFVTYLPEDPTISTIGSITGSRIWFTWVGAGKAIIMPAFVMFYFPASFLYDFLKRRAKRRQTRNLDFS